MTFAKSCQTKDVDAALVALDGNPTRIKASAWPAGLGELNEAGLYSWWVDQAGAEMLAAGLGLPLDAERIYAGQTGATRWPSGTPSNHTLTARVGSLHLKGRVRGSTFRLTLASILLEQLDLEVVEAKKLTSGSEVAVTEWISGHLEIACFAFPDRDALDDLESRVLHRLDPPLNLMKMTATPVRARLTELRRVIANPAPVVEGRP